MYKKIVYIGLVLITLVYSCTETIDFKVGDQEPKLVVDATFTTEQKAHLVYLTWTTSVYNNQTPEPVTGAEVTITDGLMLHQLMELEPGKYYTADTVAGEIGKSYTLEINYDNNTYTATDKLYEVAEMDCAFLIDADPNNFFLKGDYLVLMAAQEPKGVGDYYLWNYYVNDTLFTDTISEKVFSSDELIDGDQFTEIPIFNFDTASLNPNDNMRMEMWSISKGYFDFLVGIQLEKFRGSPFDGPPANIPTNLTNGALGYFVVADVTSADVCPIVEPYDQVMNCDPGCFQTLCNQGIIPCEECQQLGLDC